MKSRGRLICGGFFTLAGLLHFVMPKPYEKIVPPGFGDPALLVQASGVVELIGGAAIALPATRRFARWWLTGLLVAVFPANVYMAVKPEAFEQIPSAALWARLPLQPLMILWVWLVTRATPTPAAPDVS